MHHVMWHNVTRIGLTRLRLRARVAPSIFFPPAGNQLLCRVGPYPANHVKIDPPPNHLEIIFSGGFQACQNPWWCVWLKKSKFQKKKIPENWKELAQELEVSAICLDHTLVNSVDLTEEMHKNQYRVLTYTVNDLKRAHELYNLGVDSIFTNYPGML